MRSRAFQLISEEARSAPNVVIGLYFLPISFIALMFMLIIFMMLFRDVLLNGVLALVLFDLGAT